MRRKKSSNWLRNNRPDISEVDDDTLTALVNVAGLPMPKYKVPEEEKAKAMADALDWLRQNSLNMDDEMDDMTSMHLKDRCAHESKLHFNFETIAPVRRSSRR